MRLMTRYILWEIFQVFVCALAALTVFMTLAVIVQHAVREGLGLGPILRMLPYALPYALRFTVPGTMLYAVCTVYGRMAADNEISAVRAAGISPQAVLTPALLFALFLSPVAVWLNDLAVSWGRTGIHRVVLQSVEQIAYGMLRTKGAYSGGGFSIRVQAVRDRRLISPIMLLRTSNGPPMTFTAREAQMDLDAVNGSLDVTLVDCEIDGGGKWRVVMDRITQRVPLTLASRKGELADRPSDLPWSQLGQAEQRQAAQLRKLRQQEAEFARGTAEPPHDPQALALEVQRGQDRLHRLRTEPWRRLAVGFSCFFFVLIGAPVAIRLRNVDFLTTFFVCFLPVILLYYPLLAVGVSRAKAGELPPYAVWMANAAFGALGAWLIRGVRNR